MRLLPRIATGSVVVTLTAACHVFTSEPRPANAEIGEPFYDMPFSRGLGWSGTEFVEVRPVSGMESREMPRVVFAIGLDGSQRHVTTFLLPGFQLHEPIGVFGTGLYVRIAAYDGGWFVVRYALQGGPRDTIARNVPVGSVVATADERFVAIALVGPAGIVDSVAIFDRQSGLERGVRVAGGGGAHLLDVSSDGSRAVFFRGTGPGREVAVLDLDTGTITSIASVALASSASVSVWRQVAWRASGPRVAYVYEGSPDRRELWVVDQPGAQPRLLATAPPALRRGSFVLPGTLYPLAWLDGGDRIALIENAPIQGTATVGTRRVADGAFTEITRGNTTATPPVESDIGATAPSLSPDGALLLVRHPPGFRLVPLP